MDKKKIFLIVAIVIIVLLVGVAMLKLNNKTDENNDLENNQNQDIILEDNRVNIIESEDITRIEGEEEYKGLKISNIEFELISNRECEIRANVRNETNNTIEMQDIKIKTYDAAGNLLDVLGAQIDSVEPGGHTQLYALVRRNDITNIAKIAIEEN